MFHTVTELEVSGFGTNCIRLEKSLLVGLVLLSTNVAKSTYFQFNNTICRQEEGLAMGDSPTVIISGRFLLFFLNRGPGQQSHEGSTDTLQTHRLETVHGKHAGKAESWPNN